MFDPRLHGPLQQLAAEHLPDSPRSHRDQAFQERFAANLHWIHQLFFRLYGSRSDCERQFWQLCTDLFQSYRARPDDLRELDLARVADPDWLMQEDWVGMMMYVDRFAGDLNDFTEKIGYLTSLGINWVHLMPLLQSPPGSNDGGYAVSDYRAVDPRFGDMDQLRALAARLRSEGMLFTLDLVMNHTSDQHVWAQRARAGDPHYEQFYYFFPNRNLPDQYEQSLPEIFPHSSPGNFTYLPERGDWVMTVFHDYQWDLNYTNPEVFREMLKVLLFLANLGVDILRLDAVAFTWKRPGTTSQNLPEAHLILQLMKACSQVVAPGAAFIAEAIVAPREVVRYFGEGPGWGRECEVAYHATFMALLWDALATQETQLLQMGLQDIPGKPRGATWINYLRCHDDIGLGFDEQHLWALGKVPNAHKKFLVDYYSGNFPGSSATGAPFAYNPKTGDARISGTLAALVGLEQARQSGDIAELDRAIRKILMLHAIIMAYGGLPLLYYGDEIGTGNDWSFRDNSDQAYDNRWMHRPWFDWEQAERRHDGAAVEGRIFQGLRRLILLRKASPELADLNNCSVEAAGNPHLFSFLRWHPEGARTMVVANFSDRTQLLGPALFQRCGLNPATLVDKLSGTQPMRADGHLQLPAYTTFWLTEPSTFEAFQAAESLQQAQSEGLWTPQKNVAEALKFFG